MRRSRFPLADEGLSKRDMDKGLSLAQRIHPKYRPVFEKLSEADRAAVALYFLPHTSEKDLLEVIRPRVIKWYCPFADQREFPSGHRYCINVYTGCEHHCQYCYVTGYSGAAQPNCKNRFRHDLCKDLEALETYDVPPAPVHLSNSTDPLQPLEQQHRHTLFVLEKLAEHRNRFTTVTLLTKNPTVLMDDRYVQVLRRLAESIRTKSGSRQRIVAYLGELAASEQSGWAQLGRSLSGKQRPQPSLVATAARAPCGFDATSVKI